MQLDLLSEWRLAAPADSVWDGLRDVAAWPAWWPCVASVEILEPGDADGVGARHRIAWTTALPYRLAFETRLTQVRALQRIEIAATGEIEGVGSWTLEPGPGFCLARYRWQVALRRPWMRLLGPVLRPVFAWNHGQVMERGRRGLERHLSSPER
jgi:hypothetical protein